MTTDNTTGAEAPYSVTFKTPGSTLVTVRGGTSDELAVNLATISLPVTIPGDDAPVSVTEMIGAIEKALRPTGSAPAASAGSQSGSGQAASAGSGHPCTKCGQPANFKEGTNRAGKAYKGWFCSSGSDGHVDWVR